MSTAIRFGCTSLDGISKAGVILPDKDGRYDMVVGGLDVYNSAGQYYPYREAKALFEGSSHFMRRVKRGVLAAELGHPKPTPGMTNEQFVQRVLTLEERNICAIHQDIYLDFDSVRDEMGRPVIAIRSKMTPSGPHGPALKASFENPGENVCFSIRSFTEDYWVNGVEQRAIRNIVTFDRVVEPGISIAEKFKSPAMEHFDMKLSRGVIEASMRIAKASGVATESSLMTGMELCNIMGWNTNGVVKPAFLNW